MKIVKRSIRIARHNTSFSLEAEFWDELKRIARAEKLSLNRLVAKIDKQRGGNLSSAPGFRRRSCCLIYQATGARVAVCGDCVLGRRVRRYSAGESSELVDIRQ